jgi:CheY-like chemotaxis protein/signal transduction histidine kinase/HAMP domain-containing protein
MVDQLSSFAAEVTRVAKEVGTEGKLGGQARVEGVSGTWKRLTDNVNQLAGNLTTQVRAIAEVSTAVTSGDLTRSIKVEAQGEVLELKDNINQMIANLKETTQKNAQQDWLNTNLAKISGMMQGQRDLQTVSRLLMSELTPLVSAHHGAFFLSEAVEDEQGVFRLIASYGYKQRKSVSNRYAVGEGLVGQAALEKKPILLTEAPSDYIRISSGLGEAAPVNVIVMPVLFEEHVLAVIELASFRPFSDVHQTFLDQTMETIGVVLQTITANMRTEQLLTQSQSLAEELQAQQDELRNSNGELETQAQSLKASEELLQTQQEELRQTNEELEEKARLLEIQNRDIEVKNAEIESSRTVLEERAAQLSLSSRYKSEFLANMSHDLRTPLNSLLILAKLLSDNSEENLSDKQVEFARTIHGAGTDLLELINDVLDLSKVEAGKMDVHPASLEIPEVVNRVEGSFRHVAEERELSFQVTVGEGAPASIVTDEQRLRQVLKNLLSNAFKFTTSGGVSLHIDQAPAGKGFACETLAAAPQVVAFTVADTGIGMAPEKLRIVFEAFQQADGTTSRRYGGTGLGLSISREITRLLGGEITVESVEGEGSAFTLFLPADYVAPRPAPEEEAIVAPPKAPVSPSDLAAAETALAAGIDVADDRHHLEPGDRVLLIIEDDARSAETLLHRARGRGFKGIVALQGETGLALAHEFKPDAIVLDVRLPGIDGLTVLDRLKRHHETRHIPVHVVSAGDERQAALRAGAVAYLQKPIDGEGLEAVLGTISSFLDSDQKRLLVVDDDEATRMAVVALIGDGDDQLEVTAVGSSEAALAALEQDAYHCIVLDLRMPGTSGFSLLETLKDDPRFQDIPVIVHTGKELSRQEETELRRYADTIVVKDVNSPERLLDETTLFLHRVEARLPLEKRQMLEQLHSADAVFQDRTALIVDDDVRNIFALTSALESRGMNVVFAENGRDGIETLKANPHADIVLMDVMMPEMDGYATTRAIRGMPEFERLPIISLTAKAMKGDRDKSIEAGASDYITKPVDIDQLLSLMRVWLYRR